MSDEAIEIDPLFPSPVNVALIAQDIFPRS